MNLVEGLGSVEARDVEGSFENLAVILLSLKIRHTGKRVIFADEDCIPNW